MSTRPKRVVVVDADNPLIEVEGEFFWREDHDAIVAAARTAAFRAGFDAGFAAGWTAAGQQIAGPQTVLPVRPRPHSLPRFRRALRAVVLLALVLLILGEVATQLAGR